MARPLSAGQPMHAGWPHEGSLLEGKYLVGPVVGTGGMGTVVRATHVLRKAPVALKFLKVDLLGAGPAHKRFLREAIAASAVDSEHVVRVYDVGMVVEPAMVFLVMELLEGRTLEQVLADEGTPGLPTPRAVHYVLQVLRALQAAHAVGVVHRDLKPGNCFVTTREGEPDFLKILDFGISKIRIDSETPLTQTNVTLGTPCYMAPEQIRASRDADPRSDLFSVGVMLYELLSGRLPIQITGVRHVGQRLLDMLSTQPTPLASVAPHIPRELTRLVHKAMARRPEDRFPTATAFGRALVPFTDARSQLLVQRVETLAHASAPEAPEPPAARDATASRSAPTVCVDDGKANGPHCSRAPQLDAGWRREDLGSAHTQLASEMPGLSSSAHDDSARTPRRRARRLDSRLPAPWVWLTLALLSAAALLLFATRP